MHVKLRMGLLLVANQKIKQNKTNSAETNMLSKRVLVQLNCVRVCVSA